MGGRGVVTCFSCFSLFSPRPCWLVSEILGWGVGGFGGLLERESVDQALKEYGFVLSELGGCFKSFFLVSGQFPCSPGDSPLQRPLIFASLINQLQFLPVLLGYDLHLQLLSVEIFGFSQTHLKVRTQMTLDQRSCPACIWEHHIPSCSKQGLRLIPAQIPCFFCLWPLSFLRDEPNINPLCAPLVKHTFKAGVIEASLPWHLGQGMQHCPAPHPHPSSS